MQTQNSFVTDLSEISLIQNEMVSDEVSFFTKSKSLKKIEMKKSTKIYGQKKILIVDDEHFNIETLKMLIEVKIGTQTEIDFAHNE